MLGRKWIASAILAAMLCCILVSCALAVESISITSVVDHGNGKVTVGWNNPNGGVVTVGSLVNGSAEAGNRINIETDITGDSYTFENLAPGLDYFLMVMPGLDLDHAGIEMITVQEPPAFDDFRLTLKDSGLMYAVFKDNGSYSYNYADELSPSKIFELAQEKAFLVRLDFRHPTFSSKKTVQILTVVTSPTGYVVADYRDMDIPANCVGFWQTTAHMNDALLTMHDDLGAIPSGRYDVKVYVDGGFVGETSFKIK